MLDDFFIRSLVAGLGVAMVCGPLGCFVIWRRMAYFGDTLSHAALLGVALALLLEMNLTLVVFGIAALISIFLLALQSQAILSGDSILGLLSHASLALGLVFLALLGWQNIDLMAFLFGDILAVSKLDIAVVYLGGLTVLSILIVIWRPLFATTVNRELAAAEGIKPAIMDLIFMILIASVIAISIKIIGVLLITAMLIIPAAAARRLVSGPEQMAILAVIIGIIAVLCGMFASLNFDTPTGPSIVVAAFAIFIVSMLPLTAYFQKRDADERDNRDR